MDWNAFTSAFTLIFVAEMGDKTQLAALGLSAASHSTASVLAGSLLGIGLATVLGVLAGRWLGERVNPAHLRVAGGLLFVAVGLFLLAKKAAV